jgi:hypothetical protein
MIYGTLFLSMPIVLSKDANKRRLPTANANANANVNWDWD